jgi:hypothetical protein
MRDYVYISLGGNQQRSVLGGSDAVCRTARVTAFELLRVAITALGPLFSGLGERRCRLIGLPDLLRAPASVAGVVLLVVIGLGVTTIFYFPS